MAEIRFTLPERADMLRRLKGVVNISDVVANFYPRMLRYAEDICSEHGICLILALTVAEYQQSGANPKTVAVLQKKRADFIRALVDDKAAQEAALAQLAANLRLEKRLKED